MGAGAAPRADLSATQLMGNEEVSPSLKLGILCNHRKGAEDGERHQN